MSNHSKVVIKIGSSTLTTSDSSIDKAYLSQIARQVSQLKANGTDVVIVSSGAIACGLEALGITTRPKDMPSLQAAASVGQSLLSEAYARSFSEYSIVTSLVLLTRRDTADRTAYLHARETLLRLLELGVVPIVNENDTVSVEQIRFGDNDTLAALVACLIRADLLVILSDIDGMYDSNPAQNPNACLIHTVGEVGPELMDAAGSPGSSAGSGGMKTKVQSARVLMTAGIPMDVVSGRREDVIVDCANDQCPGTRFDSGLESSDISSRKLWIALGDSSKGRLVVDAGAKAAILDRGSSLLTVGVRSIEGEFESDDIVDVLDEDGMVIARGRVSSSSDELSLALGKTHDQLQANRLLAPLATMPAIHRDELFVFA